MTAKDIIDNITDDDIINILTHLGSNEPDIMIDGDLMFNTVCHNHDEMGKKKLQYHVDTKTFYCYTECFYIGNIFNLVQKAKNLEFDAAYRYVCTFLGIHISTLKHGFGMEKLNDSFIYYLDREYEEDKLPEVFDDKVLNKFWSNLFHHSWIDDFITKDVMKRFNIRFDISGNRIIIPHYNEDGNLIGIKCRNLNKDKVDEGKKYMPIVVNDIMYNYSTSMNLYGLNMNKETIKKYKKCIIGESEKFVMQHFSFYGESYAAAVSGSTISKYQIDLLLKYGVQEVIIALDKEFKNEDEEQVYRDKIQRAFVNELIPYFTVSIMWDTDNLLDLKMSPTDKGKYIFEKLFKKRIIL